MLLLYGCAAGPDAAGPAGATGSARGAGQDDSGVGVSTYLDARPAAIVDGRALSWGDLRPILAEMSGAQALDEQVLDLKIVERLAETGISIDASDAERERQLLIQGLADDPNRALRLLDELRSRRGLGSRRFDALMRRNAGLRALVASSIDVTDAMVRQQFELLHGPRRQARVILVPSLFDAQRVLEELGRGAAFDALAVDLSNDESAARGGLLEPISRVDPSYPDALRRALWSLQSGEVSRPILLDDEYAVIRLERTLPADDIAFEDVAAEMRRLTRLARERQAMDRLAYQMLSEAQVTIFDDALEESWRLARRRGEQRLGTAGVRP